MTVLGLDTSNYTTSAAVFDGGEGRNLARLLEIRPGELGLRQSDALFQHVKRLPALLEELGQEGGLQGLSAVGASTRPRAVEGSYMPCFLAGEGQGRGIASALGVPFYAHSHQQGHLAAAAWSAGRLDLLDRPFLAWHLSGGTTELLLVRPEGTSVAAEIIGGTSDISAGKLIDRAGVLMGLPFPAGKALDARGVWRRQLSGQAGWTALLPVWHGKQGKTALGGRGGTRQHRPVYPEYHRLSRPSGHPGGPGGISRPAGAVLWRGGLQFPAAPGAGGSPWGPVLPAPVRHRQRHGDGHPHLAGPAGGGGAGMNENILTPSQVSQYIKGFMDRDRLLSGLLVRGELSNYKMYPSGHHYFTLKDGEGALRCVMFRSDAQSLRFRPENGMRVTAAGRVTVFPRDGQYQLYCVRLTPEGVGDLYLAFEQLKE